LSDLVSGLAVPDFVNREKWFQKHVTQELAVAKRLILDVATPAAHTFGLCCFSAILVGVSNQESETRWCSKPKHVGPGTVFASLADRIDSGLAGLASMRGVTSREAVVIQADARSLPLPSRSVDLIVTSPPYANSHDYYLYNKLRLFWLGYDVARVQAAEIGSRNRHSDLGEGIETYLAAMHAVMSECHRVLRSGGHIAVVVGDAVIRGKFHDTAAMFKEIFQDIGLSVEAGFDFEHRQFNAHFQVGFGTRMDKLTHVLIGRRSA
jgi:site-specific DNA-methyltransferase (cytosine-N4-specific)